MDVIIADKIDDLMKQAEYNGGAYLPFWIKALLKVCNEGFLIIMDQEQLLV